MFNESINKLNYLMPKDLISPFPVSDKRYGIPRKQKARKKFFTRNEVLEKLSEHDNQVTKVAEQVCNELCPIYMKIEDDDMLYEKLDKLDRVTKGLTAKIYHLQNEIRQR